MYAVTQFLTTTCFYADSSLHACHFKMQNTMQLGWEQMAPHPCPGSAPTSFQLTHTHRCINLLFCCYPYRKVAFGPNVFE